MIVNTPGLSRRVPRWSDAYKVIEEVFSKDRKEFWQVYDESYDNLLIFRDNDKDMKKTEASTRLDGTSMVITINTEKFNDASDETLGRLIATVIHELEIHAVPDTEQITLREGAKSAKKKKEVEDFIKEQNKRGGRFHVKTQHHNLALNAIGLLAVTKSAKDAVGKVFKKESARRIKKIADSIDDEIEKDRAYHARYRDGKYADKGQNIAADIVGLGEEALGRKKIAEADILGLGKNKPREADGLGLQSELDLLTG